MSFNDVKNGKQTWQKNNRTCVNVTNHLKNNLMSNINFVQILSYPSTVGFCEHREMYDQ